LETTTVYYFCYSNIILCVLLLITLYNIIQIHNKKHLNYN
jgi:hypothetical protein